LSAFFSWGADWEGAFGEGFDGDGLDCWELALPASRENRSRANKTSRIE